MQKYLVTDFKSLFSEHGNAVSQMCGIDRLCRLTEKLLDCFGFGLVAFDTVSKCSICAIGYSYGSSTQTAYRVVLSSGV